MEKLIMGRLKTRTFDVSEWLDDEETIHHFLAAAFEDGDSSHIARAIGAVAQARNMTALAHEIGMSRTSLVKALSGEGNPDFGTILKVMKALGVELTVKLPRRLDDAA
jgi:probable addiction module antidote protein